MKFFSEMNEKRESKLTKYFSEFVGGFLWDEHETYRLMVEMCMCLKKRSFVDLVFIYAKGV